MSSQSQRTDQGELSDAELNQASGGVSRDYAVKEGPGGQCYDGIMVNNQGGIQWTTVVSSGKDVGTKPDRPSDPTL